MRFFLVAILFASTIGSPLNGPVMNNTTLHSSPVTTLFLCGDVMTGRGIDQILPESVDPVLYESYVKDARDYVRLAEMENGPVNVPVPYDHIWGDALEIWDKMSPSYKLINLETSITTNDEPWPGKAVNYRMHPENIKVLEIAGIDYCSLANNHTMDWGAEGLIETLNILKNAGISHSGAGRDLQEARRPAIMSVQGPRILIFSYGSGNSGVPESWAAGAGRTGVNYFPEPDEETTGKIIRQVRNVKKKGDYVILSVHWGSNWGYRVPLRHQQFARRLIDEGDVDIIWGHSSHHPMGIEVYRHKLILYGAGDFINDYEGISGYEEFRDDLVLMYFPVIDNSTGYLVELKMFPMQIRNLSLRHPSSSGIKWLMDMLNREGEEFGSFVNANDDGSFSLKWQ